VKSRALEVFFWSLIMNNSIESPSLIKQEEEKKEEIANRGDPPCISREERVRLLRLKFCHRAMIDSNGKINQDYFWRKPAEEEWSDLERLLLLEGIQKYGVGTIKSWDDIHKDCLPHKSLIEIRTELVKTFGTTDLTHYGNKKFNELEIEKEHEKNIKKAMTENEYVNHLHFVKKHLFEQTLTLRQEQQNALPKNC